MSVIEVLARNNVHCLMRECPPGEDDRACDEELDEGVGPEPTSFHKIQCNGEWKI